MVKDNPYFDHYPIRRDGILLLLVKRFLVFYLQDYVESAPLEEATFIEEASA
jgi:hypothetical protein